MIKLTLILILIFSVSSLLARDPLEEIDGTESWYEGTMNGNGDIVYYSASYEKDMKIYLSYLKSKQKNKEQTKSLSSKINRRKTVNKNKDDEIGELGSIKEDQKLGDDLLNDENESEIKNTDSTQKKKEEVKKEEVEDLLDDDLD
jgi:hypothetical protein